MRASCHDVNWRMHAPALLFCAFSNYFGDSRIMVPSEFDLSMRYDSKMLKRSTPNSGALPALPTNTQLNGALSIAKSQHHDLLLCTVLDDRCTCDSLRSKRQHCDPPMSASLQAETSPFYDLLGRKAGR